MMVERISRQAHEYGGKKIPAGQKYQVEHKHVIVLLALGNIVPEEGELGYEPGQQQAQAVPKRARKNGATK